MHRLNADTGELEQFHDGQWQPTPLTSLATPHIPRTTLLVDTQIRSIFADRILPFYDGGPEPNKISRGLSSMGYDLTLARQAKLKIPNGKATIPYRPKSKKPNEFEEASVIDPKQPAMLRDFAPYDNYFVIPPHSQLLVSSEEYIRMPENVLGICLGKSTYARSGILVNATPLEPGWEGNLTMEIANLSSFSVKLYIGEGICQILFFATNTTPERTYRHKQSPYQGQTGVTPAMVRSLGDNNG